MGPKRQPPVTPSTFSDVLKDKAFLNRSEDFDFVDSQYREVFEEFMRGTKTLNFEDLQWEAAEIAKMAESLPYCGRLERLVLSDNILGQEGATALATHLP